MYKYVHISSWKTYLSKHYKGWSLLIIWQYTACCCLPRSLKTLGEGAWDIEKVLIYLFRDTGLANFHWGNRECGFFVDFILSSLYLFLRPIMTSAVILINYNILYTKLLDSGWKTTNALERKNSFVFGGPPKPR